MPRCWVSTWAVCFALAGCGGDVATNDAGIDVGAPLGIDVYYPPLPPCTHRDPGDGGNSGARIVELAAGTAMCARYENGDVVCWGINVYGTIGDPMPTARGPVRVDLGGAAVNIASGIVTTCAARADGRVVCWGRRPGDACAPDAGVSCGSEPYVVPGLLDARQVAVGADHVCALRSGGTVVCWGDNYDGELGDGMAEDSTAEPVAVSVLDDATAIWAGAAMTCARRVGGTVVCWGSGYGTGVIPAPALETHLDQAVSVSIGKYLCGLDASGVLSCWRGAQRVLQLAEVTQFSQEMSGGCAVRTDGTVSCWGSNIDGELGIGSQGGFIDTPVSVHRVSDALSVTKGNGWGLLWQGAGTGFACVLRTCGDLACWGRAEAVPGADPTQVVQCNRHVERDFFDERVVTDPCVLVPEPVTGL